MTSSIRKTVRVKGAVRIVGGVWKRSLIEVVDAPGLRPTPDRVRETVFNWLTHAFGGDLCGRSALDLFAGSGALGFEAASRGAAPVVMVERNGRAIDQLRAVKSKLGADQIDVHAGDALAVAKRLRSEARHFDLIFLDPPFAEDHLVLTLPVCADLCATSGIIYVEAQTALSDAGVDALGLSIYRADKAGEVFYHLLQRKKNSCEETSC